MVRPALRGALLGKEKLILIDVLFAHPLYLTLRG